VHPAAATAKAIARHELHAKSRHRSIIAEALDPAPRARGAPSSGGQDLKGDVAEVIAVHGPISDADQANLQQYLTTKYGL
jgi:hypothetical protein